MDEQSPSTGKLVRNFLLVVFGGAAVALIAVLLLVTTYQTSRSYVVNTVLVTPEVAKGFGFRIELLIYDAAAVEWKRAPLDLDSYQAFFEKIATDVSLDPPKSDVKALFQGVTYARVLLSQKLEGQEELYQVFQELDLAEQGDYYRIELKDYNNVDAWAYFLHPKIAAEALRLLHSK